MCKFIDLSLPRLTTSVYTGQIQLWLEMKLGELISRPKLVCISLAWIADSCSTFNYGVSIEFRIVVICRYLSMPVSWALATEPQLSWGETRKIRQLYRIHTRIIYIQPREEQQLTIANDIVWRLTQNFFIAFSKSRWSKCVNDGVTHWAEVEEHVCLELEETNNTYTLLNPLRDLVWTHLIWMHYKWSNDNTV